MPKKISQAGQTSIGYLLATLLLLGVVLSVSGENIRSALGQLYTNMATRIAQPGAIRDAANGGTL